MQSFVDKFNQKYKGLAEAQIEFEIHLLPFEKAEDDRIERVHTEACKKAGIQNVIESFHAGAETHIYCHNKNSNGETFMPVLLGLADVYNMHSAAEKVDYKTLLKGYEIMVRKLKSLQILSDGMLFLLKEEIFFLQIPELKLL